MSGGKNESDEVLALEATLLRGLGGGGDLAGFETVELCDILDHDCQLVGVGEQVLLEAGPCRRELLVVVAQRGLLLVVEAGAGDGELREVALDEVARLVVEVEALELVVEGLDAPEQLRIELDRVGVRGEQGCDPLLEFGGGVVAVCRGLVEEHPRDALEQLAALFEGDHRVLERRHVPPTGDALDLRELVGHALLEGRQVMLVGDLGEGRHAEGEGTRFEEGIGHPTTLESAELPARSLRAVRFARFSPHSVCVGTTSRSG